MPAKKSTPTIQRPVQLEVPIAAKVDLLLADPLTGKPKYGAFSKLANKLFADWIMKQEQHSND